MTRVCLRRMRRRRASSVRAWRCRERRERVRGVDRDAMRCDAMRCDACCVCVRSSRARCAARVRRGVCVRDVYVCARARASRVGVARRSSSGGRRAPRATQSEDDDWTRGRLSARVLYVCVVVVFTHACTHGWMDGWMDGWMHGVIAARATRWIRERRTRAFDRAD